MTLAAPVPAPALPHPGGLHTLLSTVLHDAEEAVARLHAELETSLRQPVSLLRQGEDGHWDLLAGPRVAPASLPVAAEGRPLRSRWWEAGGVGVLTREPVADAPLRTALHQACVWLGLVLARGDAVEAGSDADAESRTLHEVIGQLLRVQDLDQVLLSISDQTARLLDADICGVLLREGDELVMRSCTGHRVVDTARLRMGPGQGVAGLVFLTGRPAKVDDYVSDASISQDFVPLAGQEQARSALAVPLRLHEETIGVLEVWRRRPSLFTEADVRRLVTLADTATIAIDNARLYDEQAGALAALSRARDALEAQLAVHTRVARLQGTLLGGVLEGEGLTTLVRVVSEETGCRTAVYYSGGELAARHPARLEVDDLPSRLRMPARAGRQPVTLTDGSRREAWVHPLVAEGDELGCVVLLPGEESSAVMDLVAGQAAMACSLMLLRQRAAAKARAEALAQVVWDLFEGNTEQLAGARSRACQLGVPLDRPSRVVYGRLDGVADAAARMGWSTTRVDRVRRDVVRSLRQRLGSHVVLAGHRADSIVALVSGMTGAEVRERLLALDGVIREDLPGVHASWGVSQDTCDPVDLPRSFEHARVAAAASRRLGGDDVCLYEQLGIVRLLLGSGQEPDLQQFVEEITGPLLAYDRDNAGSLVATVRAFFDADCSQRVAAERLFVHHKTMRYRMEKIRQLTGLDLSRHEDRMRVDFALRLLQVNGEALATDPDQER